MAWLTQWWTFLATAVVLFLPGLVAAWSLGLRRLGAWAFAPVGSVAMISLLATLFGFTGIPWTLASAAVGLMIFAAALAVVRLLVKLPAVRPRVAGARWPVLVALGVAAVLLTVRVTVYIGDPGNISQTNDAAFHLGAVRAIIEHANADSFGLAGLIDPAAVGGFYPGAWHATVSLIALMGGSIAVATNALTLVVAAVVWPLGITWLTQVVTGRRLAAAAAAAMSPTLVIFPLLMVQYGVLYPYLLAVALLPATIAVIIILTRRAWSGVPLAGPLVAVGIAAALAGAALTYSQPSVLLAWGLALWLYAAWEVVEQWRRGGAHRWWATAAVAVALLVLAVAWWRLGHMVTRGVWKAVSDEGGAVVEILSAGFVKTPPAWWMTLLLAVGVVAALRRPRTRWLAFGWLAFALLAFVAYAVDLRPVRLLLVGPWYSDPYRLSALVPVMMIPVAAAGVVLLVDAAAALVWHRRRARASASPSTVRSRVGVGAVAVLLLIAIGLVAAQPLVLRFKLLNDFTEATSPFVVDKNAWLSSDERALLARLADEVPEDVTVLGNPHTGAALGYFLTGRDVFPAKWQVPSDPAYTLLKTRLHDAATDPAVCDAVRALNAEYVLDFGIGSLNAPGTVEQMPGFTAFDSVPGFQLVDREGDASLWRITACS